VADSRRRGFSRKARDRHRDRRCHPRRVPADFFASVAGSGNPLAVPVAVILGVPLYSNAAGVLPLVEALHDKGMAMGTLLAFMMAVVALSLPEMILLRRILRPQLLGIYIAVVASGIVAIGFLFNAVLG
jgi:uncharacterized membrane protein YraQ (UPF0718 family)